MARTFPTIGQSPIDAYTTGKIPASYFEFAGTITTGEEWHGNEIVANPVLTSGSSFVAQNIVVTATGVSGSWVSGTYTKVVIDPSTFVAGGYICAAEFELEIGGTLQSCDYGVIVLDGHIDNTFVMSRSEWIMMNDFGTGDEISNLFRLMNTSTGVNGDLTSLFTATTSVGPVATHMVKFMVGTTPYWLLASDAQT